MMFKINPEYAWAHLVKHHEQNKNNALAKVLDKMLNGKPKEAVIVTYGYKPKCALEGIE